jgi:hypothetical protein
VTVPVLLPGFTNINNARALPKRLLVNIEGLDKGGKTHLALTAPGPIALFDMDRGLEGVVQKFMGDKEILFTSYRHLPVVTEADHKALWVKFERDYDVALAGKGIRSIIFDTATELWEKARLAEFGRLSNVQHMYPALNAKFRKLIDRAFDAEKNLILINKRKKTYAQNKKGEDSWTGGWERAGFGETGYMVQVNLHAYAEGRGENGDVLFACEVINSRLQPGLNGEVFSGELCSFPFIASLLRPDTELTDWM